MVLLQQEPTNTLYDRTISYDQNRNQSLELSEVEFLSQVAGNDLRDREKSALPKRTMTKSEHDFHG